MAELDLVEPLNTLGRAMREAGESAHAAARSLRRFGRAARGPVWRAYNEAGQPYGPGWEAASRWLMERQSVSLWDRLRALFSWLP